ncbi:MAG: DNA polymerase III subunit delta [Patescibacteria group bacterium]|nr:DNA polymerase III subunit delta [Patescibacteria group bacterium]
MVIFLSGPDTFRSRQKLKSIRDRFRREVDKTGYNSSTISGRGLKIEELERALISAPFLAPKRLVVVEDFFAAKPAAALEQQALALLERPAAESAVAVFWEGELPGGNRKAGPLRTFLEKSPYAETFNRLEAGALVTWYRDQAKRHGLKFEPAALQQLAEQAGNDLWRADGELQKLAAYCHGRSATAQDVQLLVADEAEANIFALTDAIGQRRTADALRLLHEQQRAGVAPLEISSRITWHFRNLLAAKAWMADRNGAGNSWSLAEALGLHPFVAKKTLGQMSNFTLAELTTRYRQLLALDKKMKTSRGDPATLLTLFVAQPPRRP